MPHATCPMPHAPCLMPHCSTQSDQRDHSSHRHRDSRDTRKRSASPEHASRGKKPRQDFRAGTSRGVLSACAVCLGRNPHRIIECKATRTWDDACDTICSRIGRILTMRDGKPVCSDWQRLSGCSETTHDRRHFCSGCGLSTHGAQACPRAQKA
jgi:hypothetical protein